MDYPHEIKSTPQFVKSISGRSVTGVFSVFGNKDAGYWMSDIVHPGAFKKTLREHKGSFFHLWSHTFDSPAIAVIDDIKEISREELPKDILNDHPEAKGGMEVVRTYLDTPRANEIFAGIVAGVPYQMSFGFDAIKYDFEEDKNDSNKTIRNLREVKLYETSDVLWGANGATVANKSILSFAKKESQLINILRDKNPELHKELKALLEPTEQVTRKETPEPSNDAHSELLAAIKAYGSIPDFLDLQESIRSYGQGV